MRWLVIVFAFAAVALSAGDAAASCGGCCDLVVELIGWSKDGRSIVVKEQIGEAPQHVMYRDGVETARWGGDPDDACGFVEAKPPIPADTFAKHGIEPLVRAWRDAFAKRFEIVTTKRLAFQNVTCTGWNLVDAAGKVVASWPRECDPNETDCVRGQILGGYLHPSNKWLLVKVKTNTCGYRSEQSYQLVKL